MCFVVSFDFDFPLEIIELPGKLCFDRLTQLSIILSWNEACIDSN